MKSEGRERKLPVLLFADDTVWLSDNEWELQGLMNMFGNVCEKKNMEVCNKEQSCGL